MNRINKKSTKDVVEELKYYNNTNYANDITFTKPQGYLIAHNSASLDDSMKITSISLAYKYGDYDDQLLKKTDYKYNSNNQLYKEFSSNLSAELEYMYSDDGSIQEIRRYDIIDSDEYSVYKKYKYDKGRLVSLDIDNRSLRFSYDEYGNCTYYDGNSLTWNKDRLLSKIKKYNGDIIAYKYDCFGNRTEKSITLEGRNYSSIYKYYYDLNGKLIFEDRGNNKIKYNYDITGLNGFTYYQGESSNTYIYLKDILGNIFALVDESTSNIVAYYEYDAWGEHRVWDNTNSINTNASFIGNINPFRYRGYYYDVETGLFYCNSRYYSPELCRWISPDDVSNLNPQFINGLNLYAYANNNPIGITYNGSNGVVISSGGMGNLLSLCGSIGGGTIGGDSASCFTTLPAVPKALKHISKVNDVFSAVSHSFMVGKYLFGNGNIH